MNISSKIDWMKSEILSCKVDNEMNMYTSLTNYLFALENDQFGEWIVDRKSKGTLENPIQMPFVSYSEMVDHFTDAVYQFVDEHPEYGLNHYYDILESCNIKWEQHSMQNANVALLDGRCITALLVGAVRAERFCDGALLSFFKNGAIQKWLLRLKEIDEA